MAIEKARLYERIVDVEEQLRQNEKLSALGLFAAEVAHEIRNPLTVMKMLYHSLDLKFPARRSALQRCGDDRPKDGSPQPDRGTCPGPGAQQSSRSLAPVNVNQLLDDLTLLTRHKLHNQKVDLERQLDPDLPLIDGDATQLEQVFLNLDPQRVGSDAEWRASHHRLAGRRVSWFRHSPQRGGD